MSATCLRERREPHCRNLHQSDTARRCGGPVQTADAMRPQRSIAAKRQGQPGREEHAGKKSRQVFSSQKLVQTYCDGQCAAGRTLGR